MVVASDVPDAESIANESADSAARWSVRRELYAATRVKKRRSHSSWRAGTEPDGALATLGSDAGAWGSAAARLNAGISGRNSNRRRLNARRIKLINRHSAFAYFSWRRARHR